MAQPAGLGMRHLGEVVAVVVLWRVEDLLRRHDRRERQAQRLGRVEEFVARALGRELAELRPQFSIAGAIVLGRRRLAEQGEDLIAVGPTHQHHMTVGAGLD